MNIERLIREKRSLDYAVKKYNNEELKRMLKKLILNYYKNLELCEHEIYCDCGYYKYHNMDLVVSSKEKAEFRMLMCLECNKKIILLQTEDHTWDSTILGQKLNIVSPFEQNSEIVPMYVLEPYIQKVIYLYSNNNQDSCEHIEFINNGYYKFEDEKLKKATSSSADFRIVTCTCCKKQYLLPRCENKYWDVTLNNRPIIVYTYHQIKQKTFCKN